MATVNDRVRDWRARVVTWLEATEDLYDVTAEYDSLGGYDWIEDVATTQGHTDITQNDVSNVITSINAIRAFVEGNFHDDNLTKMRS